MATIHGSGGDFAAAFEDASGRLRARVEAACATQQEWPERIAIGIHAAFAFAADHPDTARLLTSEALARGEEGQIQYERLIAHFAALLLPGRELRPSGQPLPAIGESATAGGVALLLGRRLNRGREGELPAAAIEAIEFVLAPYVGLERARELASRQV